MAVLLAAALAGCDGAIYTDPAGRGKLADITPKSSWTARGDMQAAAQAIDGDVQTAARGDSAGGGDLILDLGRTCFFQMVVLDHGRDMDSFARTAAVSTSIDGRTYTDRYSAPGTRRVTILYLPEPVLARYVRIRAVRPGGRPWTLAEVYLH